MQLCVKLPSPRHASSLADFEGWQKAILYTFLVIRPNGMLPAD